MYLVAPLRRLRWSVGDYLRRLHSGLAGTLDVLLVRHRTPGHSFDLRGTSGLLSAMGVTVRHGIASFGVAINVCPDLDLYHRIHSASGDPRSTMGSLLTEHAAAGRMAAVRSTLIATLPSAFGCESSQVFSGHPLLPDTVPERELPRAA
jgi:lipoate-protein ligase B